MKPANTSPPGAPNVKSIFFFSLYGPETEIVPVSSRNKRERESDRSR